MTPIVETISLKKTCMMGKVPVNALRDVDLTVVKGDFLQILVPSRSGESTLRNVIGMHTCKATMLTSRMFVQRKIALRPIGQ